MSWCASFGAQFWEGYRSIIPQDDGFLDRKPLYDAYHQLNHYNLERPRLSFIMISCSMYSLDDFTTSHLTLVYLYSIAFTIYKSHVLTNGISPLFHYHKL